MITCEVCQKKLVVVFDNEGCEEDEGLVKVHLKDCPACRAFRVDMITLRKRLASANIPEVPGEIKKDLIQIVQTDSLQQEIRPTYKRTKNLPLPLRYPRLARAGGLAALFLIIISWLASYMLTRQVSGLKGQLEKSRQELKAVRQDLSVAKTQTRLEEERQREQQAISALYFRMQELEDRFEQYSSPRRTFQPASRNRTAAGYGDSQTNVFPEN